VEYEVETIAAEKLDREAAIDFQKIAAAMNDAELKPKSR